MFHQNGAKSAKDLNRKYRGIPNATLQGNTFDVRHLDKFIQSGIANSPPYSKDMLPKSTADVVQ